MGLLTILGLRPTERMSRAMAAHASEPAGAQADDEARKAALDSKPELERQHKAAYDEWTRLKDAAPKVDKLIAAAKGPQKADLEAKKKRLDLRIAETGKAVDELQEHLEALEDPATSREDYVRIAARAKSKTAIVGLSEIDLHPDEAKKPGEKHATHTTTEYANGMASVEKTDAKRSYGPGGVSTSSSHETETSMNGLTVRNAEERKSTTSITGKVSRESKKSVEIETADGQTTKHETASSLEGGLGGVDITHSETQTDRDGSSTKTVTKTAFERGEGKLGATHGGEKTVTDASGNAVTQGGKAGGGMLAGKDGYGAFGQGEGSLKNQHEGGFNTGVVAGLHANIVCNIGEPKAMGKPPVLRYPLTLEVNLGVSFGVSAGHEKEGGKGKASIEAKVDKSGFLKLTHQLDEAELAAYVESLKAASGGGVVAATDTEFALIAAAARRGWKSAPDMVRAASSSADLKAGDSSERGGSTAKSVKIAGDVKVVSVELSAEHSEEYAAKTTRAEDGTLDAELSGSSTDKQSGKVGVKYEGLGVSGGLSHALTTSSGYVLKVDPKKDPGGVRQKALDACHSQADNDSFAAKYPECIEHATHASGETDGDGVGVSALGADGELNEHNGIQQTTTTGKDGKLEHRQVIGSSGTDGSVGIGKHRLSASENDEARAELDGDDDASLDLMKTQKATDLTKLAKAKIPFMGDKKTGAETEGERKGGLLSAAAGGGKEEETETEDKTGLKLKNKDLDAIGRIAEGDVRRWTSAADVDYKRSHEDWEAARRQIVEAGGNRQAVAEVLATFIGGSKSKRLDMVERFLRPDGDVSIGARVAFPDSLKSFQPDYEKLVLGNPEAAIDAAAKKEGPQKAGALGVQTFDTLEKLRQAITGAKATLAPAVRAEMLSAITVRKAAVLETMRRIAGNQSAQDDKAALEAEYRRMTKICLEHQFAQDDLFAKIKDWWAPGRTYNNNELLYALQQLKDLFAVWKPDYAKCADLGKKIGYPEGNYTRYKPDDAKLDEWGEKINQF